MLFVSERCFSEDQQAATDVLGKILTPYKYLEPTLIPLLGHWWVPAKGWGNRWSLDVDELPGLINDGPNQVNVTFNLDYDIMTRYELIQAGKTSYGDDTLHWSGEWGTIQFTYDQNVLTSLKYNFTVVKLVAVAT